MAATLRLQRYRGPIVSIQTLTLRYRAHRLQGNAFFGGDGQFSNPPNDCITLNGLPYQTRLRVFEERSGLLVREAWSATDGTWNIAGLNRNLTYLVVCYDATYPALAYDHQTPDQMI